VLSKRRLIQLVRGGPRERLGRPAHAVHRGFRRRGYTPEAIRDFCERIGVAKADSTVDFALLEHCLREDLNAAPRASWACSIPSGWSSRTTPKGRWKSSTWPTTPKTGHGSRKVPFSRELWIEREDFMEDPPRSFRLPPRRGPPALAYT
jgi:glutaminyl-tRNA synthetase